MNKKFSYEWANIKNKSGNNRKVLKKMSTKKRVIPKVKFKVKNNVRRYSSR